MSFQLTEPDPEYINRRADRIARDRGREMGVDLRWISAVRSLVTTRELAQRLLVRLVNYQVIVTILKDEPMIREVQMVLDATTPWLLRFNNTTYNKMDISGANVAACSHAVHNLLGDLSSLTDDEVLMEISKDAQDLYNRVAVNGMLQGQKSSGLFALFKPKSAMRPDVIQLVEQLAGVKSALVAAAHTIMRGQGPKN